MIWLKLINFYLADFFHLLVHANIILPVAAKYYNDELYEASQAYCIL